jgi:hypothetical protein
MAKLSRTKRFKSLDLFENESVLMKRRISRERVKLLKNRSRLRLYDRGRKKEEDETVRDMKQSYTTRSDALSTGTCSINSMGRCRCE